MTDHSDPSAEALGISLQERFPEYVVVFCLGLVATFGLGTTIALIGGEIIVPGMIAAIAGVPALIGGVIFGIAASPSGVTAVAYTMIFVGVVLMLAGGASGGGYTNMGMGAIGTLFGGRSRPDDDFDDPDVRRGKRAIVDPHERLRKGLRPQANPRAFWQVTAGGGYIAIALALLANLT